MAEKIWVVVKNAVVVNTHPLAEQAAVYAMYDNTFNWFSYDKALVMSEEVEASFVELQSFYTADGTIEFSEVQTTTTAPRFKTDIDDPRLTMTLAEAKAAVISMVDMRCDVEILATYPLQLQNDITRLATPHDSTARTNMNNFIDGKLSARNTKRTAINALGTVNDVIAYNVYA